LKTQGYIQSSWHPCLFYALDHKGGFEAIVCVFVDDLKVFCKSERFIKEPMKQDGNWVSQDDNGASWKIFGNEMEL